MSEDTALDPFAEIERLLDRIAHLEDRVRMLDELAYQDPLVSIPNRRGFLRELESSIARVSRYGENAAMLFVDIDGLKQINDSFGHQAGDEALIQVAKALVNGVRKSDCVARLGGDEFGILLAHADEESANETARRLTSVIESCELRFNGYTLPLGVAIGVAMIAASDTSDSIMARADRAMYREKSAAA